MMKGLFTIGALLLLAEAAVATVPQRPEPVPTAELHTFVRADDYPAEALQKREEGTVTFRLAIGVEGRVSGCSVVRSSGSVALDAASCRIMTARATFLPATDRGGRPVPGSLETRIKWQIPLHANGAAIATPPAVSAAMDLWTACTFGEAARLTLSNMTPDAIAQEALTRCGEIELLAAAEMAKAKLPGLNPAEAIAAYKLQFAARVGMVTPQAREALRRQKRP